MEASERTLEATLQEFSPAQMEEKLAGVERTRKFLKPLDIKRGCPRPDLLCALLNQATDLACLT